MTRQTKVRTVPLITLIEMEEDMEAGGVPIMVLRLRLALAKFRENKRTKS